MRVSGWENKEATRKLREQVEEYVGKIRYESTPPILFEGYRQFMERGSRKESEAAYFEVRKRLTALALYLLWNTNSTFHKQEVAQLNELLWSVSNEFTWCLAAHLPFDEEGFDIGASSQIDLFAAETAATLSEIATMHHEIIHPFILAHIRRRVEERIFIPFLQKDWGWETLSNNWSAVCAGSIGIAALLLAEKEEQQKLLPKVERAMSYYLDGFGEDGATEEGVGYWVYGFGYYTYYTAMRMELEPGYTIPKELSRKLKAIAEFPQYLQMNSSTYIPFSDSMAEAAIPSGLLCYLKKEYDIELPACPSVPSFDSDPCYRFQHISRNLWWTEEDLLSETPKDTVKYLADKQWLIQRNNPFYFAVKCGNNMESHNHNDVGSFVFAISGEQLLADLGAGAYTAGYFGEKRYTYPQTRSYYHNVAVVANQEQKAGDYHCKVLEVKAEEDYTHIIMELSQLYQIPELQTYRRSIISDSKTCSIILEDYYKASEPICFEEGFITVVKPQLKQAGCLILVGRAGRVLLSYDETMLYYKEEKVIVRNHNRKEETIYRVGLWTKESMEERLVRINISYEG
jgi:hypothetical protein